MQERISCPGKLIEQQEDDETSTKWYKLFFHQNESIISHFLLKSYIHSQISLTLFINIFLFLQ